jgi:hypothetical protein
MNYVFFVVTLTLAGLSCYLLFYMLYLETQLKQHKRRIIEVEKECAQLRAALTDADALLIDQETECEEQWPELVDDESMR